LSGVLQGDSTQNNTTSSPSPETAPIENDFPFETGNTGINKGSVPKIKNDTPEAPTQTETPKKIEVKDRNGLIKKKEPKRIHKVGKKNFFEKIIYAGKQQRKR